MEHNHTCNDKQADCGEMPELKRLNYFYGQMLGVNDFRTEQFYFREKIKLTNRCLHGYGTVCGLMVVAETPPQECHGEGDEERRKLEAERAAIQAKLDKAREAKDEAAIKDLQAKLEDVQRRLDQLPPGGCTAPASAKVVLQPGLALDCEGNQVIVSRPHAFDPWLLLSDDDRKLVLAGQGTDLYLSICYCEQGVDPVRPVMPNACGATPECSYGKVRDAYRLTLTATAPPVDTRCDSCCTCCEQVCLPLAKLFGYRRDMAPATIDNSIRRMLSTYPATTITGISWVHGATYSEADAADILGSPEGAPGIQINFSRPVLTSSLSDGVVDIWVWEGGGGKSAGVYQLAGAFEDFGGAHAVDTVRYTYQGDDNLSPGDRVMITVRSAFILDDCCRPVDGAHVGGLVPIIPGYGQKPVSAPAPASCAVKPPGYGPWTSGAGTPGSNFESWFYVAKSQVAKKSRNNKEIGS